MQSVDKGGRADGASLWKPRPVETPGIGLKGPVVLTQST